MTTTASVSRGETNVQAAVGWNPIPTAREVTVEELLRYAAPQPGLSDQVNEDRERALPLYLDAFEDVHWAIRKGLPLALSSVYARHIAEDGTILAERLCSHRTVVRVGAAKIVALMYGGDATTGTNFKYHGIGTDNTAEAFTQTALIAELTTEYTIDNTRAIGSQTQGASTNIYHSDAVVGVKTAPASAIEEHGIFSAQPRGSGTLFDRSSTGFGPFSLLANQNLQIAYDWTLTG